MANLLVISDVHQNIAWVKRILKKENPDSFDRIIFLGDFFDTTDKERATVIETSEYLNFLQEKYKGKIDFLIGNHDLSYYFFYNKAKQYKAFNPMDCPYICSGFTKRKAYNIAKTLSKDFIKETKLAVYYDEVLYSHAGVHSTFFSYTPEGYNINKLLEEAKDVEKNWHNPVYFAHPFYGCGHARGGNEHYGGLTWLDWDDEFYYSEGMPSQITGHTSRKIPSRKGNSWCMDTRQTCYAIVMEGIPEFRFI